MIVIFWGIFLILVTAYFVLKESKHIFLLFIYILSVQILAYSGFLILKYSLYSRQIFFRYPLGALPTSIQLLYMAMILFFMYFVINISDLLTFFGEAYEYYLLTYFIFGLAFILGALFFNYHWIQILTGLYFWFFAVLFYYCDKKNNIKLFKITSFIVVLSIFSYYYISSRIFWYLDLPSVIIKDSTFLWYTFLFFLVNFNKFDYIKINKKYRDFAFKFLSTIIVSHFLYYHPEFKIFDLPVIRNIYKYTISSIDISIPILGFLSSLFLK